MKTKRHLQWRKSVIMLFVVAFTVSTWAQKGIVKGRVYDTKTNNAIPFATLSIQGTNRLALSDPNGNYVFTEVDAGFKRIVVSSLGFETTISDECQVQGNQTTYWDLGILGLTQQLNTVTVGRKNRTSYKIDSPLSLIQVSIQDIEKSAATNRDVSKVIQTLPGVGASSLGRNDLIVRGGGPSENVFYLDEIEIPVINHFATQGSSGGSVGIINPDFVRELNFYTGAFPANKGNALSSVLLIKQKDGSKDRIHAKLSVGASDAALTLDGPISKKSTFIVSARQSYLQFLFNLIGLPFLPTYTDYQIKNKISLNTKNELTLIGIGAIDDMVLNTDLKKPTESQRYILDYLPIYKQWNYTLGSVYKHFGEQYYDTWVVSRNVLSNSNFKFQDNDKNKPKTSDYNSVETENKFRFERNYPDKPIRLLFGGGLKWASYTNDTYRQLYLSNQVKTLIYSTNLDLIGYQAFLQTSKIVLDGSLKLSLGVHLSGNNYNQNMVNPINQLSPRFSASLALSDKMDLNFNAGRYVMQPSYTTMGYRDSTGTLANKNENLRHIVSNQLLFGFEFRANEKMRLSLETFFKQYRHYLFSVADGVSIASKGTEYGQVGDEELVSSGKGLAYGFELVYKIMEMNRLNLMASYTYFRSEFTDAANIYRPSSWDTKHQLNVIGSYKMRGNVNISAKWRFVGGAPYTPIDLVRSSNKTAWDIKKQAYLNHQQFNTLRLNNNHILDLRIDKEFYFKKWILNLYTDIQNAYNFKTENTPIYTNLDVNGIPRTDPGNPNKYLLRKIGTTGGNLLPTIGIIVKM